MTFEEVLPLLRDGKRARVRSWKETDSWLELVNHPLFAGGKALLVWQEGPQGFVPWSGAQNDILMDWEVVG